MLTPLSLLLASAVAAPIHGSACPAMSSGARLTSGQVINGPPEEMAILKGDSERKVRGGTVSTWRVGYIYKQGQQVHLTCEYADRPTIVVKVVRPVTSCSYLVTRRRDTLSCR